MIFASYNTQVCSALNWKQPNYGVFYGTTCGIGSPGLSLKESIKFAKESNLLGIICDATPLVRSLYVDSNANSYTNCQGIGSFTGLFW